MPRKNLLVVAVWLVLTVACGSGDDAVTSTVPSETSTPVTEDTGTPTSDPGSGSEPAEEKPAGTATPEGEPDDTSDRYGFDFRFSRGGIRWCVEVKATRGDEPSFDLGMSEIQAATDSARRRSDRLRWRILRVRNALSRHPEFDWLPNPFEDGFRNRFRLHQGWMFVSYVRRRD